MSEPQIVFVETSKGVEEPRVQFPDLLDVNGNPLQFVTVAHGYPNRAARRKAGIRNTLSTLLEYQQLMAEKVALEMQKAGELTITPVHPQMGSHSDGGQLLDYEESV